MAYSCNALHYCPTCASTDTKELLKWKKYSVNLCRACKLVFATPLPSDAELAKFYQGFLFKKPHTKSIQRLTKRREKELRKLFGLNRVHQEGKKFLDFGAGTGIAFNAAQRLGLNTFYQDLDEDAIVFTQKNFELTPEKTIRQLGSSNEKFNYIFSDNVIEHLADPKGFIRLLLSRLQDGGTIVIKTPHARNTEVILNPVISLFGYFRSAFKYNSPRRSVKAYIKGFWHCDPPRHLYSFSKKSFIELMKAWSEHELDYSIHTYEIPLFENTATQQFFSPDKHMKGIKSVLVRVLLFPILPIETFLQSLKFLLVQIRLLSPGGLILKIIKKRYP